MLQFVLMLQAGNAKAVREQVRSVLVITLAGSNTVSSFSPVHHTIEVMTLGGPALVMDEPLA